MTAIAAVTLAKNVDTAFSLASADLTLATMSPVGFIQPGVAKWADRSGGIPLLYPSLTVSVRLPTAGSKVCRVVMKLALPTADVTAPSTSTGIQPAPSKAYDCLAQLEMVFPERSTQVERNTLLSLLLSALATSAMPSDGLPVQLTGSPIPPAVADFETPY